MMSVSYPVQHPATLGQVPIVNGRGLTLEAQERSPNREVCTSSRLAFAKTGKTSSRAQRRSNTEPISERSCQSWPVLGYMRRSRLAIPGLLISALLMDVI